MKSLYHHRDQQERSYGRLSNHDVTAWLHEPADRGHKEGDGRQHGYQSQLLAATRTATDGSMGTTPSLSRPRGPRRTAAWVPEPADRGHEDRDGWQHGYQSQLIAATRTATDGNMGTTPSLSRPRGPRRTAAWVPEPADRGHEDRDGWQHGYQSQLIAATRTVMDSSMATRAS